MRRLMLLLSFVAVALLGLVVTQGAPLSSAQDATPATTGHPLVGTWLIDTDVVNPDNPLSVGAVTADGTYAEVDVDGVGLGAWRATGERTADLNILYPDPEAGGIGRIRGTIEVAADGQTFTATYTLEFVGPDGTGAGEYGPGEATGTRVEVEAPGTPVGTFEELFGPFPGTPAP